MDYSWGGNRFFARKVARNEEIFLFNSYTAPDLYSALYSNNEERFEELYEKYEKNDHFPKEWINARELLITADNEWNETGRVYEHNIYELNSHTPFTETIYSSNLCSEIALPTAAYNHITEIYSDSDVSFVEFEDSGKQTHRLAGSQMVETNRGPLYPDALQSGDQIVEGPLNGTTVETVLQISSPEVATCNLAGICIDNIDSDEQYAEVAYYSLLMIDKCIHLAEYELPHIGYTSKARLNAGVGILGLAHLMAREKKLYSSLEGKEFIHQVGERHFYYLAQASLQLGKELGNAPWMRKTLWPKGWLPIDTYNRNVDQIGTFANRYNWEELRQQIIANGGIRNSTLVAHMPTETSANASGTTNGIYPIRELTMIKTDNERVNYWAAPNGEELAEWYESAWEISAKEMTETYALLQKWTDQGISADFYRKVIGDSFIESTELIQQYLYRVKMGLKSKYYMNQKTSQGLKQLNDDQERRRAAAASASTPAVEANASEPAEVADTTTTISVAPLGGEDESPYDDDPSCGGSCTL